MRDKIFSLPDAGTRWCHLPLINFWSSNLFAHILLCKTSMQYENYWADNCMTHPPVTDESGLSQLAQLQNRFWACYVEGFHILSGTRSLCCIISIHIHEHSGFLKYRKSVVPLISWQLDSPKLCTMRYVLFTMYFERVMLRDFIFYLVRDPYAALYQYIFMSIQDFWNTGNLLFH